MKRVIMRRLVMGIADGRVVCDGETVFEANDIRVGLFKPEESRSCARRHNRYRSSSIGNNVAEVTDSLREGGRVSSMRRNMPNSASGARSTAYQDGYRRAVDRKQLRFMGDGAAYAVLAMEQAIADAGLSEDQVSNPRTGLIEAPADRPQPT